MEPTPALIFLRDRLRALRLAAGLTQAGVAELAGISYIYYQSIEAGRRPNITVAILEKLVGVYGLSIGEFFEADLPKPRIKAKPPLAPHRPRNNK